MSVWACPLVYIAVQPTFLSAASILLLESALQKHSAPVLPCVHRGLRGLKVWSLGACHSRPPWQRGEGGRGE